MRDRKRPRWSRWLVLPVAAALVAASCGGDDSGDTSDTTAAAGETDVTTATTGGPDTTATDDTAADTTATDDTSSAWTAAPVDDSDLDLDATLKMAYSVAPTMLDPHHSRLQGDNTYWFLWYDRLTEISNDLEVIPMLATEWEYSADGTAFDMTLREGVTFHDGTPFNADAVVANLTRALTLEDSTAKASLAGVTSVEAIDEYHVRFNIDGKPANLPVILAGNAGAMISPTVLADTSIDLTTDIVDSGSGPYRVTDWKPNESATFERAPNFWDPARQKLAGLSITFVADPTARMNGVRTGEFDVGQSAATQSLEAIDLGESGAFYYYPIIINTVYGMLMNPTMGDLANLQVRQAINHAIDRDAINQGLFDGICEPRFQAFKSDSPYYFPEIEELYPFDQDKARQLIAESGIAEPTFDVSVSPGSYEPFAQVVQAQLAEVGITMNIVPAETTAAVVDFIQGKSQAVYLVVLGYPDLGSELQNWYLATGGSMLPPDLPEAAAIREAAAAANDASLSPEEQIEAYRAIFNDIHELSVFAPGCAAPQVWMSNPSVVGVEDMPYIWQGAVVPYTLGKKAD